MADFNRKNTYNFWHSPVALLALFCLLVLFAYNMVGLISKERETSKKKELVLAQIDTLRSREKGISSDIAKLKTDEGVEETIREKYQVAKEGEKMVTIVDPEKSNTEIESESLETHSFWGWVKSLFKK